MAHAVRVPEINKLITAVSSFVQSDSATHRDAHRVLTRQFAEVFLQQSHSEMPTPCPLLYSGPGTRAQRQLWNAVADSMQALKAVCSQFLSADTVFARATLLDWYQCFTAEPEAGDSAERLSTCHALHAELYDLPRRTGSATQPADRPPARLQWLLQHRPNIGHSDLEGPLLRLFGLCRADICGSGLKGRFLVAQGAALNHDPLLQGSWFKRVCRGTDPQWTNGQTQLSRGQRLMDSGQSSRSCS